MSDDQIKIAQLKERYEALLHAVQTAVKFHRDCDDAASVPEELRSSGPKHLRVGVDSALIQNSALAMLLIRKGVITELEYWQIQVELWENEVTGREQRVAQQFGLQVKFE